MLRNHCSTAQFVFGNNTMLDEVLSFSRWMWYYAGCGCGTVWRLAPCCYQYWVLRGDSHGQLGEVASQPPVTDSPEEEEEGSITYYIILYFSVLEMLKYDDSLVGQLTKRKVYWS